MSSVIQFLVAYVCGVALVEGIQTALVAAFGWRIRRICLFASGPRLCVGALEIGLALFGRCTVEHRHPNLLTAGDLARDSAIGLSAPLASLAAAALADGPVRWAAMAVLLITIQAAGHGLRSLGALLLGKGLKAV